MILVLPLVEAAPIVHARVHADKPPDVASGSALVRRWPFCASHRYPCNNSDRLPWWVEVSVDPDAFTARATDPHQSVRALFDTSATDLQPLASAIRTFLQAQGEWNERAAAGVAQGIVQGITYRYDSTTGWVEYPKFALEFIVDQTGDCDDASIATAALMTNLGLEAWIVDWNPVDPGEKTGHLSAAVTPAGALTAVQPPAGSRWIDAASGAKLLHVDGVGRPNGCPQGCRALGWNEWHAHTPALKLNKVVRASGAELEAELPLSAWSHDGGRVRKPSEADVDRRQARPDAVLTASRRVIPDDGGALQAAGLSKRDSKKYLRSRGADDGSYYALAAIVGLGLAGAAVVAVLDARRRAALRARERQRRAKGDY